MSIGDAGARATSETSNEGWREQYADVVEQAGDAVGVAGAAAGDYLRRHPFVGAVLAAAITGALVGWLVSDWGKRRRKQRSQAWVKRGKDISTHKARQVGKTTAAAIGPLVMHVLRNPFLRGVLIRTAMRWLRKARGK